MKRNYERNGNTEPIWCVYSMFSQSSKIKYKKINYTISNLKYLNNMLYLMNISNSKSWNYNTYLLFRCPRNITFIRPFFAKKTSTYPTNYPIVSELSNNNVKIYKSIVQIDYKHFKPPTFSENSPLSNPWFKGKKQSNRSISKNY